MSRAEDEIQKKLKELEASIEEEAKLPASPSASTAPAAESGLPGATDENIAGDVYTLAGVALLSTSLLMVFNHVRIGTGFFAAWGFGTHMGFVILPMLIGIGWLFYDYKSRAAQAITAGGVALILFMLLAQLVITFPFLSMLELVLMLLPLLAGIACLAKARDTRKAIEHKK